MVKKPKASHHTPPKKAYSKTFNLVQPGTGIRFISPKEWNQPKKNIAAPLRLALLMLLLGASAELYLNLPAPTSQRRAAAIHATPPPRIMKEEAVTANAVPAADVTGVAQPAGAAPATSSPAEPLEAADIAAINKSPSPLAAPRWRIRFGIFLSRENAERLAQSLVKKGAVVAVEPALRPMNAFTIKAGPAESAAAWQALKAAGIKLNVAPMVEVDGKYLVVGPIWLKDRALSAENTFKAAGILTQVVEERKDREVFKVLSAPFETVELAKRAIGEMHINGIEGVIDE